MIYDPSRPTYTARSKCLGEDCKIKHILVWSSFIDRSNQIQTTWLPVVTTHFQSGWCRIILAILRQLRFLDGKCAWKIMSNVCDVVFPTWGRAVLRLRRVGANWRRMAGTGTLNTGTGHRARRGHGGWSPVPVCTLPSCQLIAHVGASLSRPLVPEVNQWSFPLLLELIFCLLPKAYKTMT